MEKAEVSISLNRFILPCTTFFMGFLIVLVLLSCKKDSPEKTFEEFVNSSVPYGIRRNIDNPYFPSEVKQRAAFALSKWENGTIDSEPILIIASLSRSEGIENIDITLNMYDENKDIAGICIKEQHTKPDGSQVVIEESYPAYVHSSFYSPIDSVSVPVEIRTEDKLKNEQLWQDYIDRDIDWNEVSLHDVIPTICISIPEPNTVDVWIWVFDNAGHRSEPIKLLNFLRR